MEAGATNHRPKAEGGRDGAETGKRRTEGKKKSKKQRADKVYSLCAQWSVCACASEGGWRGVGVEVAGWVTEQHGILNISSPYKAGPRTRP